DISGQIAGRESEFDTGFSWRGNPTTVRRWVEGSADAARYAVSNTVFDIAGNVRTAYEPRGKPTSTEYAAAYQRAYPTAITNPLGQTTEHTYDLASGLLLSSTGPNGDATLYDYYGPALLNRLRQITPPAGAPTRYSYSLEPLAIWSRADTESAFILSRFDGLG